ncbi:YedE family putative selenium transporter [Chloroflexota bacterium]
MKGFWLPKIWIILAGLVMGVLAALLVKWGNPPNMGVCVACFMRDMAGALGLHRAEVVQYIRPEILGLVLGSFIAAYAFGEFRARGGSSPLVRFLLGALVMIGALVFLGCPIRATLRIAGGDLNGITGLAGVAVGALAGIFFLKRGYNLGRAVRIPATAGWIVPLAMIGLLLLAIFQPGFIFSSEKGPGSQHAVLGISLGAGLLLGVLAQRTRMCFVGAWRDIFLIKDGYLMSAVVACFMGALVFNLILGQFHLGFDGQPASHSNHLWNFLGMALVGLAATLAGGCPLRQLILSGEGDTDAGVTILGLFAGAAVAHNFGLASSGAGPSDLGPLTVILGLVITICLGLLMRVRLS